jgi:hypothetical protein
MKEILRPMLLKTFAALVLALAAIAAELPQLRVEPVAGASVFYIKNVSSQPVTAFLVELDGYPGSAFALLQDLITAEPIAPGVEKPIQVTDMTAGAAPEYVKVEAALFADGTSSGSPEKVTQLVEHRRFMLETTRDLIRRIEKAKSSGTPKATLVADLKQWSNTMRPPASHSARYAPAGVNHASAKTLIDGTVAQLNASSLDDVLTGLHTSEQSLASSKPAL